MTYRVTIQGVEHGEVFKLSNRWRWQRPGNRGIESYSRGHGLIAVRRHVARLNKTIVAEVKLVRIKDSAP